ncbi:pyridoxal phosphate-dependent aminotransferase [Desulfofustis limnaeus]|uniref:Aminotransferase n=1 Tax=Desulfofustis limnaeus TaxID=2740163 RepID=A0ABN6MB03_9BACT|nr:aminotransferase class I/II-fold pyridoxal phosphate-dependent enzyme [Desulfofustis limnaeus]BDD88652.1 aminotransferase [Desulfofustis limnaeus]
MKTDYRLADRVGKLGVETAFVVAGQAAAHAAAGNRVFPFHLGDLNLPTPPHIVEAACRALRDGKTGYTANVGIPQLREALAEEFRRTRGTSYTAENVAIQPGGKPVISKFLLTVMNPGDEVLYPNPGFPIYESQIQFHGGVAVPYGVVPGTTNFTFDIDGLEAAITERTKILIVNDLHNPTSAECSAEDRRRLAELAIRHDLLVLLDEAYFDIHYDGQSTSIVSEPGMEERSVILYTFSKRFAMTGWRLGAALGPKEIIQVIGKLNVNDESCSTHFVQWAALEALTGDQQPVREILQVLKQRRDRCVDLLNDIEGITCFRPDATFYLWPDITEAMGGKGFTAYQPFLATVLQETGVSMCARSHFGTPLPGENRFFLRLAYSGIDVAAIEEGLQRLKAFIER